MRKAIVRWIATCIISASSIELYAQDSLTIKDAGEISYRAELVVNEFRDLLNIIANSQTDIKETKDLIFNSYNHTKNRIFFDSTVMVEDDLNPAIHSSDGSKDLPIANYLNNLDLFYSKCDTATIDLSNIRVSNIKKADYLYVKVYYASLFKGRNSLSEAGFVTNNRVAEIRLEKKGGKWSGAIMHIGFYNGADLSGDTLNDVKLAYAPADIAQEEVVSTDGNSGSGNGSAAVSSAKTFEETLRDKERQKQVEAFTREKKVYDLLIEKGDQLLQAGDFAGASKSFTEAQDLKPYEIYPKIKLSQIRKQAEQAALSANELFNQFINKARIAENARKYELAKEHYMSAFGQKPEEAQKYSEQLKVLNNKIRVTSELNEKYVSGLYKEAIRDYDAAIKKDNTNSDYYLGRAKCYDKLDEFSRALKDYAKSIDLDNNNLEALQRRADLYKRNNDPFKALTDYKMYLTVDKSNMDVYSEMSDLHILTNNLKAALEDLDNGLQVNPKLVHLYYKKGLLLQRQQQWPGAIENFSNALALDSNHTLSFYYRGESQLSAGNVPAAATDFAITRLKALDSARLRNIVRYAEEFRQKAESEFAQDRPDPAIRHISSAILIHPQEPVFRYLRGEYQYARKEYKEAMENYTYAVALNRSYDQAFYKRGLCYHHLADYKTAILDFDTVVSINAKDVMAMKAAGDAYFQLAEYANTIKKLETCLITIDAIKAKVDPQVMAFIYNELGRSYNETTQYANSIPHCKAAIRLNKDYADAYYNRGYAYYKLNELSDAIEDLTKALSYDNKPTWNFTLGEAYMAKADYENALHYYARTIGTDGKAVIPGAYYKKAYCAYQLQNYAGALPDYLKALELGLDTLSASFNNELATVYLNTGKYEQAIQFYNKTLQAEANEAAALYGVASSLYLNNKVDEALTWFEKVFQLKTLPYSTVKKDKLIAGIRDDKRFKALIKKYY